MCESKSVHPSIPVFQILALQEQESLRVVAMKSELESCQQQNTELQKKVNFLQEEAESVFKALENSNKAVICELEEKLRREKQDCQELRKQLLVSTADNSEAVLKFSLLRSYLRQTLQLLDTVGLGY
jgi:hypothetical protein